MAHRKNVRMDHLGRCDGRACTRVSVLTRPRVSDVGEGTENKLLQAHAWGAGDAASASTWQHPRGPGSLATRQRTRARGDSTALPSHVRFLRLRLPRAQDWPGGAEGASACEAASAGDVGAVAEREVRTRLDRVLVLRAVSHEASRAGRLASFAPASSLQPQETGKRMLVGRPVRASAAGGCRLIPNTTHQPLR